MPHRQLGPPTSSSSRESRSCRCPDTAHSYAMRSSKGVEREVALRGQPVSAKRRQLPPALDEVDCCGIDVVRVGRAQEVLTAFNDTKFGLGGVAESADLVFGVPY